MAKRGEVDFRASGVALDSSAFIYLMKTKLLLRLEEPPVTPQKPSDFVPPPLFLPLRYELTSTTIKDLLEVLDEVLKGERLLPLKPHLEPILPPPPSDLLPQIDLYLMAIEEQMDVLYDSLVGRLKDGGLIQFFEYVKGHERIEAIKIFILLLFLAQRGKVSLWQDQESGDIYITLGENAYGTNKARNA